MHKNSLRIVSWGKPELLGLSYLMVENCIFNFALYGGMDEGHRICLLLRVSEDLDLALAKGSEAFSKLCSVKCCS